MSKRPNPKKQRELKRINLVGEIDKNIAWIFIIFTLIMPLIVRLKEIKYISPRIISPLLDSGLQNDMFSYYKWVFLMIVVIITVLCLLYKILIYNFELNKSYINIPLLLLLFTAILSLFSAEYKSIALLGIYTQNDGILTFLCYLALLFVAANTIFEDWFYRYIAVSLGVFTGINLIIILFDFFGHNLIKVPIILSLIVPADLRQYINGTINSTFSNPNYISGMAGALVAFFLTLAFLKTEIKPRIFYVICSVFAFVMLLATMSSSGMAALLIISPAIAAITFFSRERRQAFITAGITLVLFLMLFFTMNAYNSQVSEEMFGFTKNFLESGQTVPPSGLQEGLGNNQTNLVNNTQPINNTSQDNLTLPARGLAAGSGRVYIWSETLKLIKERPLTGYGPDTLSYYFPQNDINKIANMDTYDTLISKPHNMFIGVAYGYGVPALLIIIALFLIHTYYTVRHLLAAEKNEDIIFPAALFIFFCTYIIQGLFNDSVIGSAAIFWMLFGVAVSSNIEWDKHCKV